LIDVLNAKQVKLFLKKFIEFLFYYFCFIILGDLGLTADAFLAVNGELGTGEINVEWHFI
jgi:hypothetical protein